MRPSAVTAVASVNTSAAPPTARLPRCTRCQSLANPSTLEYWHIGDTTMRLASVSARIVQRIEEVRHRPRICDAARFLVQRDTLSNAAVQTRVLSWLETASPICTVEPIGIEALPIRVQLPPSPA